MLLGTKRGRSLSKKGVSVIIGYVLLVTLAVVMGGVMYSWMRSYVPQEKLDCPEDTSIAIKAYDYNCPAKIINLTIDNNGRFDIGGYFIHVANSSNTITSTIDFSDYLDNTTSNGAYSFKEAVTLSVGNNNSFSPNDETINNFVFPASIGQVYQIEITAWRWQRDKNNKLRFVSCGADSTAKQEVACT